MAQARGAIDDEQVVLGEAVAIQIPAAHLGARLGGWLLDVVIQLVFLFFLLWALFRYLVGNYYEVNESLMQGLVISIIVGVFIVWPVTIETLTHGRSLGKMAAGTRVVREDYGPISVRHVVTRVLIGWVECWMTMGALAGFAVLANKRGKRLGDYAAGTQVVSERIPLRINPPVVMPPHLARWARSADITSLEPAVATAARQFILRRNSLSPQARQRLAADISTRLKRHVSPPPPKCHPEDFVQAVLAERNSRDAARLERNRQTRVRLLGA